MILKLIRRLGLTKTSLVMTTAIILSSFFLYVSLSILIGGKNLQGIISSILIPAVISPVFIFFFIRVVIRLDSSEKRLRESEEKYRAILDNIEDAYYEVDLTGKLTFFNDSLLSNLGYSRSELMGLNNRSFMDAENAKKVFKTFNKVFTTGVAAKTFDWEITKKDGAKLHVDSSVSLIKDNTGHPIGFRGIVKDITTRKQAEMALRESEKKYRQLINSAPTGIYELDYGTERLTSVNDVFCEYTGYSREELLSMNIFDLFTEESKKTLLDRLVKLFKGEEIPGSVEHKIRAKDGHEFWVLLNAKFIYKNGKLVGSAGVVHYIDDRKKIEEEKKKLEDQLRQSKKMEAIGTLAGGIAHDFNNLLSGIMGYAELSILKLDRESAVGQYLLKIIKICEQSKEMVKQILSFSRENQSSPKINPVHIEQLVDEVVKITSSSMTQNIQIHQHISPDIGVIGGDYVQIQQILMNLCANATNAMKETGGILAITLSEINLSPTDIRPDQNIKPGRYLEIRVADTGRGIEREIMDRIFDPYFTTDHKGKGTGLGLTIVLNIVKAHNGFVKTQSELGNGSTFCVYLPIIKEIPVENKEKEAVLPSGNENILFIDDEENIAEIGKQLLMHLGYTVVVQTKSEDALELFRSDPFQFDLVITDMTMPKMSGDELSENLLRIRPDIPVILCTGHSEHISEERAKKIGIKAFMMKPYLVKDIANVIREVLRKEN